MYGLYVMKATYRCPCIVENFEPACGAISRGGVRDFGQVCLNWSVMITTNGLLATRAVARLLGEEISDHLQRNSCRQGVYLMHLDRDRLPRCHSTLARDASSAANITSKIRARQISHR